MSNTTIKVNTETRDRVNKLGNQLHNTADAVIRRALDELERSMFWDEFDAAVERDGGPDTLQAEAESFSAALSDGLDH